MCSCPCRAPRATRCIPESRPARAYGRRGWCRRRGGSPRGRATVLLVRARPLTREKPRIGSSIGGVRLPFSPLTREGDDAYPNRNAFHHSQSIFFGRTVWSVA